MMKSRAHRPWADLPEELLSTIANFLTSNPIDIPAFRAVCKSWYSSSPPLSPYNLSTILPLTCSCEPLFKFDTHFYIQISIPGVLVVSVTAIIALPQQPFTNMEQAKKCWLMMVDQLTPGKLMIRQPLTKYHYKIPLNFPNDVDVTNIHADEIARFYNFSFHPEMNKPASMWSEHVQKVVVNSDESRVFALFHTGKVGWSRLIVDPSSHSSGWDFVSQFLFPTDDARIDDIVYHETKLLGVDRFGRVYVWEWDFSSSTKKTIIFSPLKVNSTKRKRLVESNGHTYLVVREDTNNKALRFKVLELNEDLNECVEVTSVSDMVFFFGFNFSFSVSTRKLGGSFRHNCIVFLENSFKAYAEGGVDDDAMLFSNLRSGDLRVGVWHMEDPYHCGTIASYPDYSNVLWPPPAWLWRIDMSKRIGYLEAALDDLLANAPADYLKFKKPHVEQEVEESIAVGDDNKEQDIPKCWRAAHAVQVYLNRAKEIHERLKRNKSKNDISTEMTLHAILLRLEEATTKLQKVIPKNTTQRRSRRVCKSTRDDAFTY